MTKIANSFAPNRITLITGRQGFQLTPSDHFTSTYFGGSLDLSADQSPKQVDAIRRVLTIDCALLGAKGRKPIVGQLPLLFPLRLEAGEIAYSLPTIDLLDQTLLDVSDLGAHAPRITGIRLAGKASAAWPYREFPAMLPYVQLEPSPIDQSAADSIWSSLDEGHGPRETTCLIVVPPLPWLQVSLYGRYGDDAGVAMVFEIDLANLSIHGRITAP